MKREKKRIMKKEVTIKIGEERDRKVIIMVIILIPNE